MGFYICSQKEKKNGVIIGSLLIASGVTLLTASSILLKTNFDSTPETETLPVQSGAYGGLIFIGGLATYVGLVLLPLYTTSKNK